MGPARTTAHTRPRLPHRTRLRPSVLASAILLVVPAGAGAADLEYELGMSVLRSDNIALSSFDETSDTVVSPSLRFTLDKTNPRAFDSFTAAARQVPEVTEIQTFLGSVDLRLSVIARDMAHWQQIYREKILTLPHVSDSDALMMVATIKDTQELPL